MTPLPGLGRAVIGVIPATVVVVFAGLLARLALCFDAGRRQYALELAERFTDLAFVIVGAPVSSARPTRQGQVAPSSPTARGHRSSVRAEPAAAHGVPSRLGVVRPLLKRHRPQLVGVDCVEEGARGLTSGGHSPQVGEVPLAHDRAR